MNADLNNDSFKKAVQYSRDYLLTESQRLMTEAREKRADGARMKTILSLLDKCGKLNNNTVDITRRRYLAEYGPKLSEARRMRERGKAMRDAAYALNDCVLLGKAGGAA